MFATVYLTLAASMAMFPPETDQALPTVTLELTSPQAGQMVGVGTAVEWSILASVTLGDNSGLAGVSCDFTQAPTNPSLFDVPPAATVPAAMSGFSRPSGISNPGAGGPSTSAYGGTTSGPAGAKNLVQIGGMQNTFGLTGTVFGTDTVVETGLGQGASPQLIAQGTFPAPGVAGQYSFELSNPLATLLSTEPPVGGTWFVFRARIVFSSATFSFTAAGCDSIDFNQDGVFPDTSDTTDFLAVFSGAACPSGCTNTDIDFNNDGVFPDTCDLLTFLEVFAGGECECPL